MIIILNKTTIMITNFEDVTAELTPKEMHLVPMLIKGFSRHKIDDPIKAHEIIHKMNKYLEEKESDLRLTEPKLRKCCNYIRSMSLLPLIATSVGYYVTYDEEQIKLQITSLTERANSIINCANGLAKFIKQ